MAASDTILGRARNCAAFKAGRAFTVSVYYSRRVKRLRYTDPVYEDARHTQWTKPSVRYRIRVKPKQRSKDEQRPNRQGD